MISKHFYKCCSQFSRLIYIIRFVLDSFVIHIWPVLYQTGRHGGNVMKTRNTVVFIGSVIMDWIRIWNKDNKYMELSKVVSQNFRIIIFQSFSFFSKLRFPMSPGSIKQGHINKKIQETEIDFALDWILVPYKLLLY